jgi:putative FmdB family regulatory protein
VPTYEYECLKCGHHFELFQLMTDKPRKRCPKCRGKVRRLLGTGAGIIFKGSGFYATDYRKPEKTPAAGKGEKTGAGEKGEKAPKEKGPESKETGEKSGKDSG